MALAEPARELKRPHLVGNVDKGRHGDPGRLEVLLLRKLVLNDPQRARRRVHRDGAVPRHGLQRVDVDVLDFDRQSVQIVRFHEGAHVAGVRERADGVVGGDRSRRTRAVQNVHGDAEVCLRAPADLARRAEGERVPRLRPRRASIVLRWPPPARRERLAGAESAHKLCATRTCAQKRHR